MTRLGLALGVVLTALLLVAHSLAAPTKRFANSCSLATATRLVDQNHLNAFLLPNPIAQVLCGPFTGSGSQAMAVTIAAPTCWSPRRWAVFSFAGNAWQLVFQQAGFIFPPVVAVGHDIRVETAVFLPSDKARCLPNGGSQARLWHWNGRTFIPGAA